MPRRVLLMISSMRGGGSERQTLLLLRHLDRSLFTPQLYLTDRSGELLSEVPQDVAIHAFSDRGETSGVYFPGRVLRQQVEFLSELLRRESIDVIYDRTFHMTMLAGPAARRSRIPRISTIVSPPELAVPMVENRFVWLKRKRLARAYRKAFRVLAVSQQAADSAERFYQLPSGSTEVIRNPVDVSWVSDMANQDPPQRDDRLTLVCVGRMTQEKGHLDLLKAIGICQSSWPEDLPKIRLRLIGDGPLRRELESRWASEPAGPHEVEFVGKQTNPERFIKSSDALILPSLFEGMPNVVLEAMALGTPVIATRAGGTIELQRDEPTILWAKPGEPVSLAQAIRQLALDRPAAEQRAADAMKMILQHHDVRRCVDRIQRRLLQACETNPPVEADARTA
jgi:glycosyltransferase involved in cell wall biosynthesis